MEGCGLGFFFLCDFPLPTHHPQLGTTLSYRRAFICFFFCPSQRRRRGEARDPQFTWRLTPICILLTPALSLRWAQGFSLQEDNGFWSETTEPLLMCLPSPIYKDLGAGGAGSPSLRADAPPGSQTLCALLGHT